MTVPDFNKMNELAAIEAKYDKLLLIALRQEPKIGETLRNLDETVQTWVRLLGIDTCGRSYRVRRVASDTIEYDTPHVDRMDMFIRTVPVPKDFVVEVLDGDTMVDAVAGARWLERDNV